MQYRRGEERLLGVAVPLAALRCAGGWRVGEYPDLAAFGALCAAAGVGLVQLLPVNDTGGQSSPYFALSAFALHPLYLRARDLPEAALAPAALAELDAFAAAAAPGERFPYQAALDAKDRCLRSIYAAAATRLDADPAIDEFVASRPWLKAYAAYKGLKARFDQRSWREWPELRDPTPDELERLWAAPERRAEHRYQVWVQLRCAEQFGRASAALRELGVELLGDLPIMMNEDSADVWADRGSFRLELRAGSPPDAGSPDGQNWGFPIYDWERMAEDGYRFWKERIREADRYYSSYRIDHVLGFFRIWALPEREESGYLGRFLPGMTLSRAELAAAGFSDERLRWLSQPHVSGFELADELRAAGASEPELAVAFSQALDRLGDQDLYLFKTGIRGERDLRLPGLTPPAAEALKRRWRDRALVPLGEAGYVAAPRMRSSRAWAALSDGERAALEALLAEAGGRESALWLAQGRRLLGMLKAESDMLPCAEDLGSIPPGVPEELARLGMLGLRIPRWTRHWDRPGQPYLRLDEYPELSVCTPSVHDTSTLRGWWELEGGREGFAEAYCPGILPAARELTADDEYALLRALAGARSRLYVLQLQDLLDIGEAYRSADPERDRVNVPGAVADFNWTWRMGPSIEDLNADAAWIDRLRGVAEARRR